MGPVPEPKDYPSDASRSLYFQDDCIPESRESADYVRAWTSDLYREAGATTSLYGEYAGYDGYDSTPPYGEAVHDGSEPDSDAACASSPPLRVAYAGMAFQVGGVEQHLLSLVKFFNPRRVRFEKYLCTMSSNINARHAARAPFPVVATDARDLRHAANEYDVLMLWGQGFNSLLPEQREYATVFIAHGESWWCRDTLVNSSRVVDQVIAISARVRDRVCQGFPTTLIHNGVDAARLAQTRSRDAVRERLGFSAEDFVLGTVGRFSKEKQTAQLIHAAARLPREFKLVMVGWGSQRPKLMDLANELIPCRCAFVTADDYLGDLYQAMDAFCLLSDHEGFSLALAEAMLCGRPIIATNVGFVPEFVRHRVNGLVFDGTAAGLADAARLLKSHPNWANGMAAEAHALAHQHFHAARMTRQYENLFEQLHRQRRAKMAERPK